MLSVIIPTYRRPEDLHRALESLEKQTSHNFDVWVIDNDDDPTIRALVERPDRSFQAHYIGEPRLGLHYARHRGVNETTNEILVFTDDDATFAPNWIREIEQGFLEHPDMVACGGPIYPRWEGTPPEWILRYVRRPENASVYSLLDLGKRFQLGWDGVFFGANMAIRRTTLFEVGGFHPDSFGDLWVGNGETGLNYKLQERGLSIGYLPKAEVFHHIPKKRQSLSYLKRRWANEGASHLCTYFQNRQERWSEIGKMCVNYFVYWFQAFLASFPVRGRTDAKALEIQIQEARLRAEFLYLMRMVFSSQMRRRVFQKIWLRPQRTT